MKTTVNKEEIEVTIIMTGDEARWLKKVFQKPIHGQDPRNENKLDAEMRRMFWHILNREGISYVQKSNKEK